MTFADKKIEEFREKFCNKRECMNITGNISVERTGKYIYQLNGGLSYDFENWLRKTIAEAEREKIKDVMHIIKFCSTSAQSYSVCELTLKNLKRRQKNASRNKVGNAK